MERPVTTRTFYYYKPTRVLFGMGTVDKVGFEAKQMGGSSIFLVTDKLIEEIGVVERVKKSLEKEGLRTQIFDEIKGEPKITTAKNVGNAVRENEYDLVVGVGGGSVLDMAKVASIMATNSGEVENYVGFNLVKNEGLTKILLPTTAGTGSEVSSVAVMTVEEALGRPYKRLVGSEKLFANLAIVDPLLTVTLPPSATASTGVDALSHAIEGMMSTSTNPVMEALASKAIKLIATNLKLAYVYGENLYARYNMSLAALISGLAMGSVYGHSIGNTLSTRYSIPHGVACAIPLPYVMEYNRFACMEKFALITELMGENVEDLTLEEKAFKAVVAVKKLVENLNIPTSLKDLGVPKETLSELAEECFTKYHKKNNPRKLTREDAIKLYERMWKGNIGNF